MTIAKRGDSSLEKLMQDLHQLPMSLENAFFYLELASSVWMSKFAPPLKIEEAKKCVVDHFKDFTKLKKKVKKLPLPAVEAVLKSEGFRVDSEDDVCDFILKWARVHYPDPEIEERREILTKRLVPIIRFPNMSISKLKEVLVCPEFAHERVSKLVTKALFFKAERHTVYFDLKKEECVGLHPDNSHPVKSHKSSVFYLGSKKLYLLAKCCKGQKRHHFGLYLCNVADSETCTLDYEFAALKKSSEEFKILYTRRNGTVDNSGRGSRDLLSISWADFMSDDCDYFVDGILHLRAEIGATLSQN